MTLKFTVETTEDEIRDATPEEIVAWHVLEIAYICNANTPRVLCSTKCPLNLLRYNDEADGCMINLRAHYAKELLEGKKIIVTDDIE